MILLLLLFFSFFGFFSSSGPCFVFFLFSALSRWSIGSASSLLLGSFLPFFCLPCSLLLAGITHIPYHFCLHQLNIYYHFRVIGLQETYVAYFFFNLFKLHFQFFFELVDSPLVQCFPQRFYLLFLRGSGNLSWWINSRNNNVHKCGMCHYRFYAHYVVIETIAYIYTNTE